MRSLERPIRIAPAGLRQSKPVAGSLVLAFCHLDLIIKFTPTRGKAIRRLGKSSQLRADLA